MNEFYYARLSLKGHWSILHNSLPSLRLWSRESPYKFSLRLREILVTHVFARSRVWLVASELEVHPSKCLVSYLRRLKRGLLWNEGAWWVSRVEGAIRGGGGVTVVGRWVVVLLYPVVLSLWRIELSHELRPCLASISLGQIGSSLLNKRRGCLFLSLSALSFVFGVLAISCIGRGSA